MLSEVFIIESLTKQDREDKRLEGELIFRILKMGGRKPKYHFIETLGQFNEKIKEFSSSQYRYLHISCHGSPNSFKFYFGSISFEQFADLFRDNLANRRIFISACESVNKDLASLLIPSSMCYSIVGPYEPIRFDDAAMIWASYYYLVFKNDQTVMDRKLILRTLGTLTKLYQININYYSISRKRGIKLIRFIKGGKKN